MFSNKWLNLTNISKSPTLRFCIIISFFPWHLVRLFFNEIRYLQNRTSCWLFHWRSVYPLISEHLASLSNLVSWGTFFFTKTFVNTFFHILADFITKLDLLTKIKIFKYCICYDLIFWLQTICGMRESFRTVKTFWIALLRILSLRFPYKNRSSAITY